VISFPLDTTRDKLALGLVVLALPGLILLGNPAIALLVAGAGSIILNQNLLSFGTEAGKYALQTAIVLLGFCMDAGNLLSLSAEYTLLVAGYVLLTLALGIGLGLLISRDKVSNKLISSGTAICGGTTIASLSPIIKASPEQTGVALALVFLLNAVALFTFPYIGEWLELSQTQFGVWVSLAIHDTSSVVATAVIYGEEAGKVATTLKLGRTLWLIPLLLIFAILEKSPQAKLRIPGFIVLFIGASILGSTISFPDQVISTAGYISKALLVVALFCIGSEISRDTVKRLRGQTLVHGLLLWLIVVPATLLIVVYFV